jgi:hypothetical protein
MRIWLRRYGGGRHVMIRHQQSTPTSLGLLSARENKHESESPTQATDANGTPTKPLTATITRFRDERPASHNRLE